MTQVVHQVFNSALVSGPETLVLPNLESFSKKTLIVLLQESRLSTGSATVSSYARSLSHEVHEISVRSRFDMRAIFELRSFWKKSPPDIIHAHGPKASLYAMLATAGFKKKPRVITTHHGVRMNDTSSMLRLFETIYEKAVIPNCDRCLTVCTSDRELLITRGIQASKLEVHLNGVDRRMVSQAERAIERVRVRSLWAQDLNQRAMPKFLVGVVGRLSIEKQHSRILEGFKELLSKRSETDMALLCFGSGPLLEDLKAQSKQLGIEDRVYWMGYRKDISAELAGLDVLLSLSSCEGLPINLIEAGWSATPVVATAVDGVRDLIVNEKHGILLEPTASSQDLVEAIGKMISDEKSATVMALAFQDRVRTQFSRKAWTARLSQIYAAFYGGRSKE